MTRFRRLVLELGHGAADPETIGTAARFAQLLGVELFALFVEDETLLHASALPFAREISALSLQWRPLQADRLQVELKAAAEQARRHLEAAAQSTGIKGSFEVRRGDIAAHVTELCIASDIVVVSPPRRPGSSAGFVRLQQTASRSVASVLHLPPSAGRQTGPIVAIAANAAEPGLELARWIAAEAQSRLLILAPAESGIEGEPDIRLLAGNSVHDITAALGEVQERLIVMTRAAETEDPGSALAAARAVPVLVLEPV